jgi:putative FmdB family regulatory protein
MPRYTYQCECGLQFEATAPMKDHSKPKPCPECKAEAQRLLPEDVDGVFKHEVTGPVPQNTGISQLDANIDRAIGTSAAQGREVIEQRNRDKEATMRATGAKRHHLARVPDNEGYRVLEPEARDVHARANLINALAMRRLRPQPPKTED